MIVLATVALLVLHAPGGAEVLVNPEMVVSLRARVEEGDVRFAAGANCLVNLADGKYVVVVERCSRVLELLEQGE